MKQLFCILITTLFLLSCQNKSRQDDSFIWEDNQKEEQSLQGDTAGTPVQQDTIKEKPSKPSTPTSSSSSHTQQSVSDDNMRGFDPASEDDMDDNGMSRYMENDDEDGWD